MKRVEDFDSQVYLVNTGWTGGSGGTNGRGNRFPIPVTRAIVTAITEGRLRHCATKHLSMLNLDIPTQIDGVDSSYLDPKGNWSDPDEYDAKAKALAELFIANIENFAPSEKILAAGPQL